MQLRAPDKVFIGAPGADGNCGCNMCPFMAMNTLEKLYLCLRDLTPVIEVPESIRERAKLPLDRMLAMTAPKPVSGD